MGGVMVSLAVLGLGIRVFGRRLWIGQQLEHARLDSRRVEQAHRIRAWCCETVLTEARVPLDGLQPGNVLALDAGDLGADYVVDREHGRLLGCSEPDVER